MSLFRPGPVPKGVSVVKPAWPNFTGAGPEPGQRPLPAMTGAFPGPLAGEAAAAMEIRMEDTLNDARLEASRILQDAAEKAESAQEESHRQGYDAGVQEGIEAGKAELELLRRQAELEVEKAQVQADAVRQMAEVEVRAIKAEAEAQAQQLLTRARDEAAGIIAEARREQHHRIDQAADALLDLAVAAATRLVHGHLALQPNSVVGMVAAGIRRLKDTDCTVRISPQDLPLLEAQRSTLERELGTGQLILQPDLGLTQGSYTLASPRGGIDGRIDTQATQLKAALQAALGGNPE